MTNPSEPLSVLVDGDLSMRILSVQFLGDWIEITFSEEHDRTADVVDTKVRAVKATALPQEVTTVYAALRDLVDAADLIKAPPPQSFVGRR